MKILLVDDSEIVRATLRPFLERMSHTVVEAVDGLDALRLYRIERPELVLIDAMMPVLDGYEAARRMREFGDDEWVPIIFLSSNESDQDLDRAIQAGGDDYLVKPVSYAVLNAKIRAMERIGSMRRKIVEMSHLLAAANQELEQLSRQDSLTGIANRRYFDSYLQTEWRRGARQRKPLALILIDVDHFKAFNDRHGHLGGDDCLRQIGRALSVVTPRATDLAARYGGEEFALVLPGTPIEGAIDVARSVARAVDGLSAAPDSPGKKLGVTVSQGVVSVIPTRDSGPQALVERADQALYLAKQQGRDRFATLSLGGRSSNSD